MEYKKWIVWAVVSVLLIGCSSKPKNQKASTIEDAAEVSLSPSSSVHEKPSQNVVPPVGSSEGSVQKSTDPLGAAIASKNDEAIFRAASDVLLAKPNDVRALNAIGMFYLRKGRFKAAQWMFSQAITQNPAVSDLHTNMGVSFLGLGDRREAMKSFRKAIELDPTNSLAAANIGSMYIQEQDFQKAMIALEIASEKIKGDYRIYNNYGIALMANGNFEKAEDSFQKALKAKPNDQDASFNLASLYINHVGKLDQGLEILNRLKFLGPKSELRSQIISLENKAKMGLK